MANWRASSYGSLKGRVDRAGQPEFLGHRRQSGEHGEGVRPAHHIEVEDLPALFPKSQPFGQEEEVELAALGGLREVHETAEVDVAARARVGPDRGVVDTGEMGGEVDLFRHGQVLPDQAA